MTHVIQTPSSSIAYLTARPTLPLTARAAIGLAVLITMWSARSRSRKQLRNLSDAQLNDIGISRRDADLQASLPFWRP